MTPIERLQAVASGKEPDRVPVLAITRDFSIHNNGLGIGQCLKEPSRYVEAELNTLRELKTDAVWDFHCGMPLLNELFGSKLYVTKGIDGMDQPAHAEPVLASLQDFRKWPKVDVQGHPCMDAVRLVNSELKKAVGSDIPRFGWASPPFRSACFFRGVSNLMMDLIDEPAEMIEEFMEVCLEYSMAFAQVLIDSGANYIFISNPTASTMLISKKHYERFVHPYTKRLNKYVQDQKIPVLFHICGDWHDRLDLLDHENVTIFHVDKLNVKEAKAKFTSAAVMGNVKTVETLLHGTPTQVAEESIACLKQAAKGGRYILSGDCVITPKTPKENLKAMYTAGLQYGIYPITLDREVQS